MTASYVFTVRLTQSENTVFEKTAHHYSVRRSQIIRRLLRELVRGRPDDFEDEYIALRELSHQLMFIGRNFNQMPRRLNRNMPVSHEDIIKEFVNTKAVMKIVSRFIGHEIASATRRTVSVNEVPD